MCVCVCVCASVCGMRGEEEERSKRREKDIFCTVEIRYEYDLIIMRTGKIVHPVDVNVQTTPHELRHMVPPSTTQGN